MNITINAAAKINLYLDITKKRENGYHDIKGIMHKISLADKVSVEMLEATENEICLSCSVASIPLGIENIAYRAAEMYLECFARRCYKVNIHIEKNIPAAGGLAGGSTDAAAVLRAMQTLVGDECDIEPLINKSATLGADVPFCLVQGTMITEGIGDILTPCASFEGYAVLICNTAESVSTPEAYGMLDRIYNNFVDAHFDEERFDRLIIAIEENDISTLSDSMFNIFEEAVLSKCPLASEAKQIMLQHNAVAAMMSGSGSTIFGIYRNADAASEALDILSSKGYTVAVCDFV